MISNPRINQLVQIKYSQKKWPNALLQGMIGKVIIAGKGKPRNHAIEIDGVIYIVPCGNIFSISENKIIDDKMKPKPKKEIQLKLFFK